MSLEIHTYIANASDTLAGPWLSRLEELGMVCEFHPAFSISTQSGFLPIKLRLINPTQECFRSNDYLSGFEFDTYDFDLNREFPKQRSSGLVRSLVGVMTHVSRSIDPVLRGCKKKLVFNWGSQDLFEMRLAITSSLVLAGLGDGISYYPADGTWYDKKSSLRDALQEIKTHEAGLPPEAIHVHPFEDWV